MTNPSVGAETGLCQSESFFVVDPELSAEEPAEASCIAEGDAENVLKHAIRAVSFRNRSGFIGNVGNFRWCNSWAGIIAE